MTFTLFKAHADIHKTCDCCQKDFDAQKNWYLKIEFAHTNIYMCWKCVLSFATSLEEKGYTPDKLLQEVL